MILRLKQIQNITVFIVLAAVVSIILSAMTDVRAHAEPVCTFSGKDGTNKYDSDTVPHYTGDLVYQNGSCNMVNVPDTGKGGTALLLDGGCPSGKVAWEGQCYPPRTEYTNIHPTESDGSAIPDSAWATICSQTPAGMMGGYHYVPDRHRCESGSGCSSIGNYFLDGASDVSSIGGDCEAIGHGDVGGLNDVNYKTPDDIARKTADCKAAGLTMNPTTHECNWTKETCSKKNGGQGVWIDEKCQAYSDFANAQDCANKAKGEWKQDPKDASHWECVKPGTDVNQGTAEDADAEGVDGTKDTTVNGQCGAAHTNIISCDGTGAVALNNVLKIVISVLTVLVGIAAVGGLAWASILYAKATDNQASVSEARTLIQNIVIGLLVYVFLLAIVNFLIPGGIFPT